MHRDGLGGPSAPLPDQRRSGRVNDKDAALIGLSIIAIAFGGAYLVWQWMGATIMPTLSALGL